MKFILTAYLLLISTFALAGFNEIECEGSSRDQQIDFEIEQPLSTNTVFRRAALSISTTSGQENFQYTASVTRYGLRSIIYQGAGLRLEVDLWPDNQPRWGRSYRAILNSFDLNQGTAAFIDCQFPNAN